MTTRATDQAVKGESGIHLILAAVDAMGHIWHPTTGIDSGIDGQIELRDPATAEVRNVRIAVQSRANPSKWMRETPKGFSYRPPPKELSYWLSSNQPVLLICSRPATGDVYWRSVQEWVSDPIERAKGYIRFDKERDRFDAGVASALFDLKATGGDRIEPAGPLPLPEAVTTNLMPIVWRSPSLCSMAVPTTDARALFEPAWREGLSHPAAALREGRLWSLIPIGDEFREAIGGTDYRQEPFSTSGDPFVEAHLNLLKELIVRSVAAASDRITWHGHKRVAYFRRRDEQKSVQFRWSKAAPRTVVFANFSNEEDRHFTGYRHDAAKLAVRRTDAGLSLQISPTYLFTWDGRQISSFHADALAGIRRIEKHRAASTALRMWEHLLVARTGLFSSRSEAGFDLAPLIELQAPQSIDEKSWERLSEAEGDEAQGSIYELLDEAD